jgi:hypothetical protein
MQRESETYRQGAKIAKTQPRLISTQRPESSDEYFWVSFSSRIEAFLRPNTAVQSETSILSPLDALARRFGATAA